jgi:DNA-binding transcriptional regulator YiaG
MYSPIKKVRERLLLTQEGFSSLLGICRPMLSEYETGRRKPRFALIKKILIIAKDNNIDVTVDDFFVDK